MGGLTSGLTSSTETNGGTLNEAVTPQTDENTATNGGLRRGAISRNRVREPLLSIASMHSTTSQPENLSMPFGGSSQTMTHGIPAPKVNDTFQDD